MDDQERIVIEYCEKRIAEIKEEKRALSAANKSASAELKRYLKMIDDIRQLDLDLAP